MSSVTLMSSGLSINFISLQITCNERSLLSVSNKKHTWDCDDPNPNNGPWGLLLRQLAINAFLKSPKILCIQFESGDYLDIETAEGQYESVIIEFPPKGESIVMEVF
ncbi:hypothetical protein OO007_19355 [Cocleimonas sp. KMM 6892]|uniref:hypothetical protein n=1 Tax=unclassified Cocleimonas TaxID=2639732 RepID=UPI002DB789C2|nr:MULTISPECIES: hypothetical protein [unclassified Cocleimonas]MEB8434405.1 hypothetical protein [Cocleimonas sp. KMM 6892]MEC4717298.1 hypothetical protein [Cocleimonas sp. KMM 6895]MEC4746677.1 hypothetical protein [Cocleimonas sp. KMM 6896]